MSSLPFWTRPSELVLWTELISAWTLCSYWLAPDTSRTNGSPAAAADKHWRTWVAAALAGLSAALLPPPGTGTLSRLALAALLGSFTVCGVSGRSRLLRSVRGKRWLTEWEIALVQVVAARIAGFLEGEAHVDAAAKAWASAGSSSGSPFLPGSDLRLTLGDGVSDDRQSARGQQP